MKKGSKILGILLLIIVALVATYGYGYLVGSGYFFERDFEVSKDSTIDITGSAEDVFMEQYTVMTQAGRDSYGKFFTVYKPTNAGEPENTVIYTIFVEESEGNLIRLKVIDERLNELVYWIKDSFKTYTDAKITGANSTGIVVSVNSEGYEYNVFYPMIKTQSVVKVRGVYNLEEDGSLKTEILETNGRSAKETLYNISSNFTYAGIDGKE